MKKNYRKSKIGCGNGEITECVGNQIPIKLAKEGTYKRIARSEQSLSGFAPAYAWSLK